MRDFLAKIFRFLQYTAVRSAQLLFEEPSCPLCSCTYNSDVYLRHSMCAECTDFFAALSPVKTTLRGDHPGLPELVCFSAGFYQGLLRESIYQIKYLKNQKLLNYLGLVMQPPTVALIEELSSRQSIKRGSQRIVLLPVPLHKDKLKERSFNQAAAFAGLVQKHRASQKMQVRARALRRVRATAPQFGLSQNQRRSNLAGAFSGDSALLAGKQVIIVDDILTSGATLYECAIAATAAGATVLGAVTFGRARWQASNRNQANITVPRLEDFRPDRFFPETLERHDRDGHLQSARRHPGCKALP